MQPYTCEMEASAEECIKNNIHNRSAADIEKALRDWKVAPLHYVKIDYTYLLKKEEPTEVTESKNNDDGVDAATVENVAEEQTTSNVAEGEAETVILIITK